MNPKVQQNLKTKFSEIDDRYRRRRHNEILQEITHAKQMMNQRGLLNSSGTMQLINKVFVAELQNYCQQLPETLMRAIQLTRTIPTDIEATQMLEEKITERKNQLESWMESERRRFEEILKNSSLLSPPRSLNDWSQDLMGDSKEQLVMGLRDYRRKYSRWHLFLELTVRLIPVLRPLIFGS